MSSKMGKDLNKAVSLLMDGELVAIPTETVYGLAGNALDTNALIKIFEVKNRPKFDPLIVHIKSIQELEKYVLDFPENARKLANSFMPGPLTLLLLKKKIIPDLVTAGSDKVAIRIPSHPMTLSLLERLPFPLAAPSANPFTYISPTNAQHVADQLGEKIKYILDGGPCEIGLESTIISFESDRPTIHRKGGLSIEAIEAATGPVNIQTHSSSNPSAPGQLSKHYAPKIPVRIGNLENLIQQYRNNRVGILSFYKTFEQIPKKYQVQLSPDKNLEDAAKNFFSAMRKLDQLDIDVILTEFLPEEGLGRAINDRLSRSASLG